MSEAIATIDTAFQAFLQTEPLKPVQRNLFTGEPEALRVEVPEEVPEDETAIDEGSSLVKTEDMAQLIVSGFGLYLGKKSERLVVRKDKTIVYQFPFFRIQEVVVGSKGISISSDLMEEFCVRHSNQFLGRCGQALCVGFVSLSERNHSDAARSVNGLQ